MHKRIVRIGAAFALALAGTASAAPVHAAPDLAPAPAAQGGADMPGPVKSGVDAIPNGGKRIKAWEDLARAKGHFSRNPADHPAQNFAHKERPRAPKPPGLAALRGPGDFYLYNTVFKNDSASEGVMADFTIANPYVNGLNDGHTLMEIAVQGGPGNGNIVEIGWQVDDIPGGHAGSQRLCSRQGTATTDDPCLFVYHWESDDPTCYNTCQFVNNPTANYDPGDRIPNVNNSSGDKFKIRETSDAWWVSFGSTSDPDSYVGYYLKSNWSGSTGYNGTDDGGFDQMGLWQMFGEIAAGEATPCTDMGNGSEPVDSNSDGVAEGIVGARIVNVQDINDPGSVVADTAPSISGGSTHVAGAMRTFKMNNTAPINDFQLGGPGWKGNNTLPGATNGCG